jgi:hypothetical protein
VALLVADGWTVQESDSEPCLNKEFLSSLKALKVLLEREKEHRNIVCSRLKEMPEQVMSFDI